MRLRRPELLLVGVGLALAPAPASAQEGPPVYIVSVPMDDGLDAVATRAGAAARAALRRIEGVDWRSPDQRFLGYDDSALSVLDRARQQLDAGRVAYLELEFDRAITELQGAVENFDAASAALEDPGDLGQALLFLGASHAFNGQTREAATVFRRLHTQMPFIEPDPNTFPPDVVRMYARARPRDARNPSGRITIDSNPPGAIAYVDFLARGRTPLTVRGLIEGEHVVRVTRPGATPFVEPLNVRRRRSAETSAYLVDAEDLEGLATALDEIPSVDIEEMGDGPISTVATLLQVEKIGVLRVSRAGRDEVTLELLLFDVATGRRLVRGQQTYGTAVGEFEDRVSQAVTAAFQAALTTANQAADEEQIPAFRGQDGPRDQSPSDEGGGDVLEEWWFWTLIGLVAAGGIAAAIAIPVATQGPPLGQTPEPQVIFRF